MTAPRPPYSPLYRDADVTNVDGISDEQSDQINALVTRVGEHGYLSNLAWNLRNRYLSSAHATFSAAEVRTLVEAFLLEKQSTSTAHTDGA